MLSKQIPLGIYEKALPAGECWLERLRLAKTLGFDFVEMSVDETDERLSRLDWSREQRLALVNAIVETGVRVPSMCLSAHRRFPLGSEDDAVRAQGLEIMRKAIQFAQDVGIRVIQLAGYDVYYEEGSEQTRKDFADNLKKAVEMAAVHGVVLGFETMETEFMNTVAKSMKYVSLIDNPYLGVYPDVGNLTNAAKTYGTSVLDDLETGRGHLVAMHLKETVPGKFREIPFLTGHVDFPAVIRKGWQLGVRRFVTEMWDTGKPEWKEDICFAHDKMSEILDTME